MDDIKLFAKKEKELETLIHTVRIYSRNIWKVCNACNEKWQMTSNWQDGTRQTLGENETYKYLGILEADTIKQAEIKEKIQKEYLRKTKLK